MKKDHGFSLIELLVVVAIIGLLSSVVMASLNSSRVKARDAKRVVAAREMQKAVELYALANEGRYPAPGAPAGGMGYYAECGPGLGNWTGLQTQLASYIPQLPTDPAKDCNAGRFFWYQANEDYYKITIIPEDPTNPAYRNLANPSNDGGSDPCIVDGSAVTSWALYNKINTAAPISCNY